MPPGILQGIFITLLTITISVINLFSRLADVLSIFPMRKAGKTFENQQSSLLLMKE